MGYLNINCPRCGIVLHLDPQSKDIDMFFNERTWGKDPEGFFRCKGCGLIRPDSWWDVLQLDIATEINFTEEKEMIPEELAGKQEAPWGD